MRIGKSVKTRKPRRSDRRGASVVEFAVVAPVFIVLVFGMIEFGRMIMVQQLLTNAAREGARTAVIGDSNTNQVKSIVENYLDDTSVDKDAITVAIYVNGSEEIDPTEAATGSPIKIEVSVPLDDVGWLPAPWFLGGRTLTTTSTMRRE